MTWIVTNGKSGEECEYIALKRGGFDWTKKRSEALLLANQKSARAVTWDITGAVVVAVVDEVL